MKYFEILVSTTLKDALLPHKLPCYVLRCGCPLLTTSLCDLRIFQKLMAVLA